MMQVRHRTEKSSRDAQAALEATERLVIGVGALFDAVEARLTGLERRMASVETSVDSVARPTHKIEQALTESNYEIMRMLTDSAARLPPKQA